MRQTNRSIYEVVYWHVSLVVDRAVSPAVCKTVDEAVDDAVYWPVSLVVDRSLR